MPQIMQYCSLPLEFAGHQCFSLLCDEEDGGILDFVARIRQGNDLKFIDSKVNFYSGRIRFFIGQLDMEEDYENFLNVKIDRTRTLQLSDLQNPVKLTNLSPFEINSDAKDQSSFAKIINSDWVRESYQQSARHHIEHGYTDSRQVEFEHLVFFSKECYVEFLAMDPWEIIIGPDLLPNYLPS